MSSGNEQAFFIGDEFGKRLFAVLHRPMDPLPDDPTVVICAPFAWEKVKAHRTLVTFARHLNEIGVTALRFDFQGQGDSDGDFDGDTFERMVADTERAVSWVRERLATAHVFLHGLRLGATVAAAAAARLQASEGLRLPLMLWEPVTDLHAYLYDYLRMNIADQSLMYKEVRHTRDQLVDQIMAGQEVRVDGFVFSRPLWEDARSVTLDRIMERTDAAALLLQIDRGKRTKPPRKAFRPLKAACFDERDDRRFDHTLCSSLFWLQFTFHRPREEDLFRRTVEWLEPRLPRPAAAAMDDARITFGREAEGAGRPRQVTFTGQDGNALRGMFAPGSSQGEVCLILINSGLLPRYCYHRHYVKLTRSLAPLGISVLMYDGSGLGDSDGEFPPDKVERHWHAIQRGYHVPDALAAIRHAREHLGAREILLAGACGGANTALLAAAAAPGRLLGCVMIAMPVVFSDPDGDREALHPFDARLILDSYWKKIANPVALLRLLSGKSNYRLIFESIYRPLRERAGRLLRRAGDAGAAPTSDDAPANFNAHLLEAFDHYSGAGGQSLFMMASFDHETEDFESLFVPARLAPGSSAAGQFEVVKVEGASHTFAEAGKEELAFAAIQRWIAGRLERRPVRSAR